MSRRLAALCLSIGVLGGAAVAAWWWQASPAPQDDAVADLPLPPFPPRITEGKDYESCLAALAEDPAGAMAMADTWLASGGGGGAAPRPGLALVVTRQPAAGGRGPGTLPQHHRGPPQVPRR